MQMERHLVKENTLSNPDLVPDKDVVYYIPKKGKGWVCEVNGQVVGFAIIDLLKKSVWALLVDPEFCRSLTSQNLNTVFLISYL